MNVIILEDGVNTDLLNAELAGHPFKEYVSLHVQSLQAVNINVLGFEHRSNRETINDLWAENDVLIMDANVWFSQTALRKLLSLISRKQRAMKLIASDKDSRVAVARDVLAFYLPAQMVKKLFRQVEENFLQQEIRRVGDSVLDCDELKTHELDFTLPPVRICNLLDFSLLERCILYERACKALLKGVRLRDPNQVSIRGELKCGGGVEIDNQVIIEGMVSLGDGVKIGAHSILKNATIGAGTCVNPFSIIEDAIIGSNTFVGPYGRIRPGSNIGDFVQIGNFVEIKKSDIGPRSRINHHAFIGDATLEKDVTIGAGTITCNHNGLGINHTEIKAGAYIGSGSQLVAPVRIGENATIGAGSTITQDAPAEKLTLARSRQMTIPNWTHPNKKRIEQ